MQSFDLNVASPEQLAPLLRAAAQAYAESASDLQCTWQDPQAGRVWAEFAKTLETAANRIERQCDKYFS